MEYYSHTNNKIMVAHFPGHTREQNVELMKELSQTKFTKPDNIDIVSVITKDRIEDSMLNKQLVLNNIDYINPIRNRNLLWRREDKIKYVLQGLKQCTKEYTLILDGEDVAIISDLTDIVDVFETYHKDIIYNATIWMYPHTIVDNVENRGQYGEYCYLNAGCAFGKTSALIDFYEKALALVKKDAPHSVVSSEQYYIRKAFNKMQDTVFFDYDCKIFQIWHKAEYTLQGDRITILR